MKAISRFVIWIAIAMVAPAGLFADQGEELEQQIHQTEVAIDENAERGNERAVEELKHQLEELREKAARFHEHQSDRNRQIDQQRDQIQEFRNAIEKLTDEGHRDEAAKLSERLELYVQRIRKGRERGEPNRQDAIIHELNQHRENLEREFEANSEKLSELGERGGEEAIGHVKRVMQELREELAGVHHRLAEFEGHEAQERREREEHREYEERREHEEQREHGRRREPEQRREGGHEEMERRIQHMREAMENLHAAGRPDLAEGIAHEAEQMEREFHERGRHEEDSHGREAVEALHQLGGQIEHVNNQLDRTNDQLAEVANMLRILVGKLGIHTDDRNDDRDHRKHEGRRPHDDRERSGDHRERHDDDDRDHGRGHEHHSDGEHDDHDGDGNGRNRDDDRDDR